MYRIRRVPLSDATWATLVDLEEQVGLLPAHKPSAMWWLAYGEEGPVGYAGLLHYPDIGRPGSFLLRCGVLPEARGQGLQRRFIQVREAQAKRDGYDRCFTYTAPDNLHSANNLIACGYRLYTPPFR